MPSLNLIRWGGLAYLLAGVSLILQQLYALAVPDAKTDAWVMVHTLGYFGLVLGLLGLPTIFAYQGDRIGAWGVIGFVLAFVGNGLTIGAAFLNTFVVPVAPNLATPTGPLFAGPAGLVILLSALLVTLGFILFGIATYRAGVLPRGAALLVIVSAWFGIAAAFLPLAFLIGGVVFGIGNAWLGYAVWSRTRELETRRTAALAG